ncbi:hypothetical protein OAT67_08665 [Bacteriovoracaceae bacterium]|nr:hypothetical protein [Bacteriovoracaceae bacterium]|tara:strand:- start:9535 stop:9912 length:378 start_codon:yes stop_codon:yes gene_type:complete
MLVYKLLLSILATFSTIELTERTKLNNIQSSAIITIVISLLLQLLFKSNQALSYEYSLIAFGASFVGMTHYHKLKKIFIFASAVLFVITFEVLRIYTPPIGGLLGLSAFVAVAISYIIQSKFQKE